MIENWNWSVVNKSWKSYASWRICKKRKRKALSRGSRNQLVSSRYWWQPIGPFKASQRDTWMSKSSWSFWIVDERMSNEIHLSFSCMYQINDFFTKPWWFTFSPNEKFSTSQKRRANKDLVRSRLDDIAEWRNWSSTENTAFLTSGVRSVRSLRYAPYIFMQRNIVPTCDRCANVTWSEQYLKLESSARSRWLLSG